MSSSSESELQAFRTRQVKANLLRPGTLGSGLDRAFIQFELPDGQRIDFMIDLADGENRLPRWRASSFLVSNDGFHRKVSEFDFPTLDDYGYKTTKGNT